MFNRRKTIYIISSWEGKSLPRKTAFTMEGDDLKIRRLRDVYDELPETINGSTTGVNWIMEKIHKLNLAKDGS